MEKIYKLTDDKEAAVFFGKHDENLKTIEQEFGIKTVARGENLTISGAEAAVKKASKVIDELFLILRKGGIVGHHEVLYAVKTAKENDDLNLHDILLDKIEVSSKRRFITPRTAGQKVYIDAIRDNDIVFAIGPAGTGKTYLAMAMAVNALKTQQVSRIILTRPAIEAGESLGYLPGDLYAKVFPYIRPLYDALYDMMEVDKVEMYLERGIIEIAPIAFMRGRTLNDAFIILDEAQNSTEEQMKMFLTRLGFDSKAVITGDITGIDLPKGKLSGLVQVKGILKDIKGIEFVYFSDKDVVRHELVQEIIRAYNKAAEK